MTDIIPSITVHPGELTEHPLNSNSHNRQNLEELGESRKQFGQFKNVVAWTPKEPTTVTLADGTAAEMKPGIMYVIAGNGFHQASILRNDEAIEVKDVSHLSHEDALSLMEADNASPLGSSPKLDQMLANMEIVRQHKPDNERLQGMLQRARELRGVSLNGNDDEGADTEPQIDKAEELRVKWGVESGQLWQLGEHRLICGDCTDKAIVARVMDGEKAEIEIHDPPYGMELDTDWSNAKSRPDFAAAKHSHGGQKHNQIIGDNKDYDPAFLFDRQLPKELFLWGCDYYAEKIPNRNAGSWLVWDKRIDDSTDKMYGSCFETCWSLRKHKRDFIRVKWARIFGTEKEPDHKRHHPTQKPVLVYEWLLSRYSKGGDISADYYLGAGSHLLACQNLNRQCRAIEIDPGYVAVTLQRWADHTGKTPELIQQS